MLTHEIAHHIDARDFENDYGPMISCVERNYARKFQRKEEDDVLCKSSFMECLKEQNLDQVLSCSRKARKACQHKVTISHMGELSADTWAAQVTAIHMKAEGLSKAEGQDLITQNLMKLCGSADEGIHTSGDFRITETAIGHSGIRDMLGCRAKKSNYCQM